MSRFFRKNWRRRDRERNADVGDGVRRRNTRRRDTGRRERRGRRTDLGHDRSERWSLRRQERRRDLLRLALRRVEEPWQHLDPVLPRDDLRGASTSTEAQFTNRRIPTFASSPIAAKTVSTEDPP